VFFYNQEHIYLKLPIRYMSFICFPDWFPPKTRNTPLSC